MSRFKNAIKYVIPLPVLAFAVGAAYAPAAPHHVPPATDDTHAADVPETAAPDHLTVPKTSWESAEADSGFSYTVKSGDTLSSIAKSLFGHAHYWPSIWKANEHKIHNPNVLIPGMKLDIPGGPAKVTAKLTAQAYSAIPKPPPVHHAAVLDAHTSSSAPAVPATPAQHYACGDGDGDGFDMPCSQLPGAAHPSSTGVVHDAANVAAIVNPSGYGSFQACVISRESGGNSAVMNSSGHYGLYQFSYSTWVANGGSPGSFGNASVAEQNQVFANTMASGGGASNWSPYDGC